MALGIIRVAHVQITVPPEQQQAAKDFYVSFLGLKEISKPDTLEGRGEFRLDGNNIRIHVAIESGVDRNQTRIAYEVGDLESIEAALKEKGFALASGPKLPGYRRFETRDPFGNRIEFMQKEK